MFGKNDGQFDERQVTPAPGARWGYIEDINRLVVRLPPRLAGPVCNIEIEGAVKDIAFIQLGLSEALEPICIIVDNIARRSHRETSTVLALESFDSVCYDAIPRMKNCRTWRNGHREFRMLPQQQYTGIYAFDVKGNEPVKWLCLQPDRATGRFEHRVNWVVTFTPIDTMHQRAWTFELEASSKVVLFSEETDSEGTDTG